MFDLFFDVINNSYAPLLNVDISSIVPILVLFLLMMIFWIPGPVIQGGEDKKTTGTRIIIFLGSIIFAFILYFILPSIYSFMANFFGVIPLDETIQAIDIGSLLILLPYWIIFFISIIIVGIFPYLIFKKIRWIWMWIIIPIVEEFFYRGFILTYLVMYGTNNIGAVYWTTVLFTYGLYHWMPRDFKNFNNYFSPYTILIRGFLFAFIAINYGVIMAIIIHAGHNALGKYITSFFENKESGT